MSKHRHSKEKQDHRPEYVEGLNPDQLKVFEELERFCDKDCKDDLLCIKGFAGTGKTYVLTRFFAYWKKSNNRGEICLSAPTNKAVGVLQVHTPAKAKEFLSFSTIHKLLGVKASINDDGEEVFEQKGFPELSRYSFVVIDEVSMLDDTLFFASLKAIGHGEEKSKYHRPTKLIFMGDPKQIPPVNKEDCEPFLNPDLYGIKTVELSQIMRQKDGNKIIEASFCVRENITKSYIDLHQFQHKGQFETCNTALIFGKALMKQEFESVFSSKEFKSDPASIKIIAYRNVQVRAYNNYVRSIYHSDVPKPLPQLIVGELIINNGPVMEGESIILNNNTEMTVISFTEGSGEVIEDDPKTVLKHYNVRTEYFDYDMGKNVQIDIRVLQDQEQPQFQVILKRLSNAAIYAPPHKKKWFWMQFYKAKQHYADVNYAYAITCHKSQGSTYKNVYVDLADISGNDNVVERNRIIYTAITRASEKAVIITNK